jgi:hypothetical protein
MEQTPSKYESDLLDYLKSSHPDLVLELSDELDNYVSTRVENAMEAREAYLKKHSNQLNADEVAYNSLLEGLKFSKFDTVKEILFHHFEDTYEELLDNGDLDTKALTLLNECKDIFDKYNPGDDFPYSDQLDQEIAQRISLSLNK